MTSNLSFCRPFQAVAVFVFGFLVSFLVFNFLVDVLAGFFSFSILTVTEFDENDEKTGKENMSAFSFSVEIQTANNPHFESHHHQINTNPKKLLATWTESLLR